MSSDWIEYIDRRESVPIDKIKMGTNQARTENITNIYTNTDRLWWISINQNTLVETNFILYNPGMHTPQYTALVEMKSIVKQTPWCTVSIHVSINGVQSVCMEYSQYTWSTVSIHGVLSAYMAYNQYIWCTVSVHGTYMFFVITEH